MLIFLITYGRALVPHPPTHPPTTPFSNCLLKGSVGCPAAANAQNRFRIDTQLTKGVTSSKWAVQSSTVPQIRRCVVHRRPCVAQPWYHTPCLCWAVGQLDERYVKHRRSPRQCCITPRSPRAMWQPIRLPSELSGAAPANPLVCVWIFGRIRSDHITDQILWGWISARQMRIERRFKANSNMNMEKGR